MQATISIVTASGDSVTAVPRSAVLGDMGNLFVFVETGDKGLTYERHPVVTGIADDRFVEIVEGVLPGDKVVTQGNYQLQYVPGKKTRRNRPRQARCVPTTPRRQPSCRSSFTPAVVGHSPWLAGRDWLPRSC